MERFFPTPVFGWVYLLTLIGTLVWACYHDLRTLIVPKKVTLTMLALALVLGLIRGGWLGTMNSRVWLFSDPGVFLGAFDGLLFAVAGFFVGFVLFFAMWILGTCGGGDVKLFAALGAWVGPKLSLWILAVSILVVIFVVLARLLYEFVLSGLKPGALRGFFRGKTAKDEEGVLPKGRKRVLGFSLPLTLACIFILPPLMANDLNTGWIRIVPLNERKTP